MDEKIDAGDIRLDTVPIAQGFERQALEKVWVLHERASGLPVAVGPENQKPTLNLKAEHQLRVQCRQQAESAWLALLELVIEFASWVTPVPHGRFGQVCTHKEGSVLDPQSWSAGSKAGTEHAACREVAKD